MSAVQLREWIAFDELEPFGPEVTDQRFASVVKAIVNKGRKKPVELDACRLFFGDTPVEGTPAGGGKKDWRKLKAIGQQIAMASRS